jgi:glutathione S-transferase
MLIIHHLGISQSDRIVWLCEELNLPYELKRYQRDPATGLAPPPYRALHPFGTAPVITDGALVLGESGAIIDYINGKYGGGRLSLTPQDPAYADYLFWFHFANGSLMPASMIDLLATMFLSGQTNPVVEAQRERANRAFAMVEKRLGEAEYFAGAKFTAADIIMLFPLTTMRAFVPRDLTALPNIRAYLQRIGQREALKRAMKKADPEFSLPLS